MEPSSDLLAAQARLSQEGAALIASYLDERLSVMLRADGRRQIVLRFKETFRGFSIEWFRGFRVTVFLTQHPDANESQEIVYAVEEVERAKGQELYYLTLTPISEGDRVLSGEAITGDTVPTNIAYVELTAGEVELTYLCHKPSGLFVLEQRPQAARHITMS